MQTTSPVCHLGNRLALLEAQCLNRQSRLPQIGLGHGDRRAGERPGDAVVVPEHLGGAYLAPSPCHRCCGLPPRPGRTGLSADARQAGMVRRAARRLMAAGACLDLSAERRADHVALSLDGRSGRLCGRLLRAPLPPGLVGFHERQPRAGYAPYFLMAGLLVPVSVFFQQPRHPGGVNTHPARKLHEAGPVVDHLSRKRDQSLGTSFTNLARIAGRGRKMELRFGLRLQLGRSALALA